MNTSIPRPVIEQSVRQAVARALDVEQVGLSSSLVRDLDAQSLDMLDIAFSLEREFGVQFPQTDLLQRAAAHFGEDELVENGKVTEFGLRLLRKGMPELDPEALRPGLRAMDVVGLITVDTFVRLVVRLLEAKREVPTECEECGEQTRESERMPELVCPACGHVRPLPSGDDVLIQDLIALTQEVQRP